MNKKVSHIHDDIDHEESKDGNKNKYESVWGRALRFRREKI